MSVPEGAGKEYAILAAHSDYSLMRGVDSVEAVCAAAARRGAGAIALTDVNALYIAVRFWEVARECGLAPIVGADLWVEPWESAGEGPEPGAPWAERAILLATNGKGYRRLCRILSDYHLCRGATGPSGNERRRPERPFSLRSALLQDREGLWVLVPCCGAGAGRGLALAGALRQESGAGRLAVLIPPWGAHRHAVEWARGSGLPVVASPDAFFVDVGGHAQHRLLRAIARNTKISRLPPGECLPESAWLMDEAALRRHLPDLERAVEAASKVAADCVMNDPPWGSVIFPSYRSAGNGAGGAALSGKEAFELLKRRAYEGSIRRYGAISRVVQERLDREMEIIRAKGFAEYFLVVADIVTRSPRTCGRGSAAASLVSYALGITHVDPVRYDLYFDRFLNMGRVDPPDIDVDFAWDERDEVIAHVLSAYGEDRAAMVCNHLCFRGRASVREVAKVYGLPEDEIGNVTKKLSRYRDAGSIEEMTRTHPRFKNVRLHRPWPGIFQWSARLEGHPRHLSVHCGGVVIVPDAIWDHVPVQPAAKGVNVIHWEKDQTEDAGLVKIDLLGNRSLAVIRDTLAAVEEHHGVAIPYERFNPLEDLRTKELIRRGDTVGVFYVESPAMRQLQEKTLTGEFERLVVHSSIIRPAANAYIREYVRRLRGGAYRSIHPLLDDLMPETFGIMVYQEDVAKVAIAMAGFDAASADGLRKILSRKHKERQLADYRQRFYRGGASRGFDREVVDAVWEMILSFGGYSFCKPHSASYALVSFKSAYLRAHYPAEFMAAVISNQGGYYSTFAYISECRRMGLEILPPDVNASAIPYTGCDGAVRVGLMQVQKMKETSREAVVAGRRNGPHRSLEEFLARTEIDPADVRRLILAGALDSISGGRTRPEMMWRWALWNGERRPAGRASGVSTLFMDAVAEAAPAVPAGLGDYDPRKMLSDEVATLGFLISRHPLTLYREAIGRIRNVVPARDLRAHTGRRITTVGWLVTGKVVDTREGEPMEFVSFEDTTALYEATFFPGAYRRFCHMLSHTRPYVLRGKVEEDFGSISMTVSDLRFLR
jgi:error-prone DNA polymerase